MTERILGPTKSRRRRRFLLAPISLIVLIALVAISSASGVLTGSPSKFESGNDPTLGLGNMIVNTPGNSDWISVTGQSNYVHLADAASTTSDDSFTPGQKQDAACPTVEGHKNPPKDDFTDVASFNETNTTPGSPNLGDVYLYGATIRYAPNGNASENIELKQGLNGDCAPDNPDLLARTPGDKLIAIDYLGGGSAVQFHVLTWVASGPCFVANDPNPCWGATVQDLTASGFAEGGVNDSPITVAQNPISGVALKAGQFAEFGVNLSDAGIIPSGTCGGFAQTIWESRSSGSSFVSSTKDITIEDHAINPCGVVTVTKVGSDGGSQAGAVFTLYEGSDTTGDVVGTCTVIASGDCVNDDGTTVFPPSFGQLQPGTYTIDETTLPPGGNYAKDPNLPHTFTVATGEEVELTFTDPRLAGALRILKNSTKGGAVTTAGAVFSYDGHSVTDNAAGDEDSDIGQVCVSGLDLGDYLVDETSPPPGYGGASEDPQTVTVVSGTNCTDNQPGAGATATFTNPPLSDIQVNFRDGGSDETSAVITCDNTTGTGSDTPATGWDTSRTVTGVDAPTTVHCTIVIDP
jgi:Prealbumin-like fold domain